MADEQCERLVRLLAQHHDHLYRYVYGLIGNAEDARDVLQETSAALFQKADAMDPSRPFLPWAYRFAYYEVLKWRQKHARTPLALDDDVVELLAGERLHKDSLLRQRLRYLPECFRSLSDKDLRLIRGRYFEPVAAEKLAEKAGLSRRTLFRELDRIRKILMDCIETKRLAEQSS